MTVYGVANNAELKLSDNQTRTKNIVIKKKSCIMKLNTVKEKPEYGYWQEKEGVNSSNQNNYSPETEYDELPERAFKLCLQFEQCGILMLQRELKIGYMRAKRILKTLEGFGLISQETHTDEPQSLLVTDMARGLAIIRIKTKDI